MYINQYKSLFQRNAVGYKKLANQRGWKESNPKNDIQRMVRSSR